MTETFAQQQTETKSIPPNPQELIAIARVRWRKDREIMKQTGLSRTTIWRMEDGRFTFSDRTIGKLVNALNGVARC